VSRACLVRVLYEGGPRLSNQVAVFGHSQPLPRRRALMHLIILQFRCATVAHRSLEKRSLKSWQIASVSHQAPPAGGHHGAAPEAQRQPGGVRGFAQRAQGDGHQLGERASAANRRRSPLA
jgi:hypothetical protein